MNSLRFLAGKLTYVTTTNGMSTKTVMGTKSSTAALPALKREPLTGFFIASLPLHFFGGSLWIAFVKIVQATVRRCSGSPERPTNDVIAYAAIGMRLTFQRFDASQYFTTIYSKEPP